MKRKLLLAALCVVGAMGGVNSLHAQTDVTSTYIKNPSFEGDGKSISEGSTAPKDWSASSNVSQLGNNNVVAVAKKGDKPGSAGNNIDASVGTYFLSLRLRWNDNSHTLTVSQALSTLPAGNYTLSADYNAFTSRNDGAYGLTFAAKTSEYTLSSVTGTFKTKQSTPYNTNSYSNASTNFVLTSSTAVTISVALSGKQSAQAFIDNFTLSYTNYTTALSDVITHATEINSTLANATLGDAITTAQSVLDNKDDTPAYQETINNAVTTLKAAITTAVATTPGTKDSPVYWNTIIVNPSFEGTETTIMTTKGGAQKNPAGWTGSKVWGSDLWHYAYKVPENATDGSNSFKIRFNWEADTYSISQTLVNLPRGKYKLTADVNNYNANSSKCKAKISVNTDESESAEITTASKQELVFYMRTDGDANIKLTTTYIYNTGSCEGQLFWDNVTLANYGTEELEELEKGEAKDALQAAITAATNRKNETSGNVGSGVFQITSDAQTALEEAISSAQGVYDEGTSTKAAYENATETLNAAVTTYNNAALIAPAAGAKYYIKVATTGHAKKGNAVVVSLGSTSNNNPTGYTFNASAAPAAYLAQAVAFISAEDAEHPNRYYITFEGPEGTLYLTNGTLTGSAAGWKASQIQGTTDPSKKMGFDIVATATANVFNIYNTETNSSIACQNPGNLYTESGNADFTLDEASQASVDINIKDGKWATRIFPFAPELPNGLVAYTAEVNGDALELTEVKSPVANVPYILKNNTGDDITSTSLTGYGTADRDSYAKDVLIGIYTDATIPDGSYVLQTPISTRVQAFYPLATTLTGTPYRCYLALPNSAAKRNAIFFDKEEGTTGIEAPNATNGEDGVFYNLAGQRVNRSYKGIIIQNRKAKLNN